MSSRPFPVVFSDLDGTLLDHDTYSFESAVEALGDLARPGIPVVLCSSKTRAEIEYYQDMMGLDHPFVSENGGALFVPPRRVASARLTERPGPEGWADAIRLVLDEMDGRRPRAYA